jgi:hypothetical protein
MKTTLSSAGWHPNEERAIALYWGGIKELGNRNFLSAFAPRMRTPQLHRCLRGNDGGVGDPVRVFHGTAIRCVLARVSISSRIG